MGMEPPQLPTQVGCWVPCGRGGGSMGSKQSWGCAVSSRAGVLPSPGCAAAEHHARHWWGSVLWYGHGWSRVAQPEGWSWPGAL